MGQAYECFWVNVAISNAWEHISTKKCDTTGNSLTDFSFGPEGPITVTFSLGPQTHSSLCLVSNLNRDPYIKILLCDSDKISDEVGCSDCKQVPKETHTVWGAPV